MKKPQLTPRYIDVNDKNIMSQFIWDDELAVGSASMRFGTCHGQSVVLVECDGQAFTITAEEQGADESQAYDSNGQPLGPED